MIKETGRKTTLCVLVAALIFLASCVAGAAERLTVYAVNYPLAYFAQRIGGEHINVVFPVPADVDPAFWEPDVNDIAGFQQADLILLNGAGYAHWLKRASLPRRKLVNTSAAFADAYINVSETVTHQHGPGSEHSHAGAAFTTWLDFSQAIAQARAVQRALERQRPQHTEFFIQNFQLLAQELISLDKRLKAIAARDPDKAFVVSHPVYQYLARRYQINIKSVLWEPDVLPDDSQWQALQRLLDTHNAEWIIWEGQPNEELVTRLQVLGLHSLVFNPGANVPAKGDFIALMKTNIMELERAYRQ